MLVDEYGTAANIKSKQNKISVLGAIKSAQYQLRQINQIPKNGYVIFTGTISTENKNDKEKKISFCFEPFKPVKSFQYMCDDKFHTEQLEALLADSDKIGFIIIDGSGCLLGIVQGNDKKVLYKFNVDLPKKHGRGGQSALRFSRLRDEKRHNYVRKVAECVTKYFITQNMKNVKGIIIGGSADLKNDLFQSDLLDPRLKNTVIGIVDISYGGESGFNEAIHNGSHLLTEMRFTEEKRIMSRYFQSIEKDENLTVNGVHETMSYLEMGLVDTLIVWDDLDLVRIQSGEGLVIYKSKKMDKDKRNDTAPSYDGPPGLPLIEILLSDYKNYGCKLEIVSDKTPQGHQFCKGFGGIGAFLRYEKSKEGSIEDAVSDFSDDDF